ncbi:toprim domain-containing protein [Paracoccaceae bacterium]|nr:toprim domain-containing protein [Paracoccaceae bacterium]
MNFHELARALNGKRSGDGYVARCPAHEDHTPSLSISSSSEKVLFYCHAGCTQENVISALKERGLWENQSWPKPKVQSPIKPNNNKRSPKDYSKKDHAKSVWGAAIPAENTLIETYLTSRNITVACPDSLRFHQNLRHKDSEYFPAMVGEITSSLDNTFQGVHRTFLQRDGSGKAPLKEPKIMLGQASGGVVKLCEATETVALAEGIETALSVAQMTENPVWAALSAGNLKSLLLPKHILSVDIFADGDEAGKDAATTAARRLSIEGRSVRIITAPDGQDFNDLLCADENDDPTRSPEQLIKRLIDDAAVFNCPLDDLLERLEENKGAAFEPDVLDSLNHLKTHDFPRFENLRNKIKKSGCRVGELDRRMKTRDPSASDNKTDIDEVLACASDAELFSDNNKRAFANYTVKDAKHTAPLGSRAFQLWVTQKFLGENGSAPRPETLRAAVNTLEAKALFGGKKMPVYYRLGMEEDAIQLDLGNDATNIIEINKTEWLPTKGTQSNFLRPDGMHDLPNPVEGGTIDALRLFLNTSSNEDFVLVVAWLLAALRPTGPYPVLALTGEQGSAKSTTAKVLRSLVDPFHGNSRSLPDNERDLFIAANSSHVMSFDNISFLPKSMSDALCRLATGGGFSTRKLYSDDEEQIFNSVKPIILNGIGNYVTRPDLADRSISVKLKTIKSSDRLSEQKFWEDFENACPRILGALLTAVSHGLQNADKISPNALPRMADFSKWVMACETAFWERGTFEHAYALNAENQLDDLIDADPLAIVILGFMDGRTLWTGTSSNLLAEIKLYAETTDQTQMVLPVSPDALGKHIERIKPILRQKEINISRVRSNDKNRTRLISIEGCVF